MRWVFAPAATVLFDLACVWLPGQGGDCGDYGQPACSAQSIAGVITLFAGLALLIIALVAGAVWALPLGAVTSGALLLFYAGGHQGATIELVFGIILLALGVPIAVFVILYQVGRRLRAADEPDQPPPGVPR